VAERARDDSVILNGWSLGGYVEGLRFTPISICTVIQRNVCRWKPVFTQRNSVAQRWAPRTKRKLTRN